MSHQAAMSGTITFFKLLHPLKAKAPILATLLPMVTEARPVQLKNVVLPMLVTLLPMVTEVKLLQL